MYWWSKNLKNDQKQIQKTYKSKMRCQKVVSKLSRDLKGSFWDVKNTIWVLRWFLRCFSEVEMPKSWKLGFEWEVSIGFLGYPSGEMVHMVKTISKWTLFYQFSLKMTKNDMSFL
jgi:hypothetical protein